jgi:hypothetical protein
MKLRKSYVETPLGQLHTVECGSGPPVLGVALPEQRPDTFAREVLAFVTAPDG